MVVKTWYAGEIIDSSSCWREKKQRQTDDKMDNIIKAMNMSTEELRYVVEDRKGWRINLEWLKEKKNGR